MGILQYEGPYIVTEPVRVQMSLYIAQNMPQQNEIFKKNINIERIESTLAFTSRTGRTRTRS